MNKFSPLDVLELQECLCSYKFMLNALVTEDEFDMKMKEARESSVEYLISKCEEVLKDE